MKYLLLDLLCCPFCNTHPLELFILEKQNRLKEKFAAKTLLSPYVCTRHCAYLIQTLAPGKPVDAETCDACQAIEIASAILYCPDCARWFPVKKGIPSILPDFLRIGGEVAFFRKCRPILPDDVFIRAGETFIRHMQAATSPQQIDKDRRVEMNIRDRESRIYDLLYPDDKFQTELATYARMLDPAGGGFILDLGCGTGRVTKHLANTHPFVVGFDLSFASLLFCRNRLAPDRADAVHLLQGDACYLPFCSAVFDEIISVDLFCYIPSAKLRRQSLQHAARVIKNGGAMVMAVYNFNGLKKIMGNLGLAQAAGKEGYKANNNAYYYNFSPKELIRWVKPYFEITDLEGTDNRLPVIQRISHRLNAKIDLAISRTFLSLPVFAREMVIKGIKKET